MVLEHPIELQHQGNEGVRDIRVASHHEPCDREIARPCVPDRQKLIREAPCLCSPWGAVRRVVQPRRKCALSAFREIRLLPFACP